MCIPFKKTLLCFYLRRAPEAKKKMTISSMYYTLKLAKVFRKIQATAYYNRNINFAKRSFVGSTK